MTVFGMISVLLICITCAFIAFLVLASLPNSPVRDLLLQLVAWLFAGSCVVYTVSPVDILPEIILGPFGLPDDLIAIVMGIVSIATAIKTGRESKARSRARRWEAEEASMREQSKSRQKTITVQSQKA